MRIPGHKLTVESDNERGAEHSATGTCTCGWEESGSSQKVVRQEYSYHLKRVQQTILYSEEEDRSAAS